MAKTVGSGRRARARERERERERKNKKAKVRAVGKVGGTEAGGREKSANDGR